MFKQKYSVAVLEHFAAGIWRKTMHNSPLLICLQAVRGCSCVCPDAEACRSMSKHVEACWSRGSRFTEVHLKLKWRLCGTLRCSEPGVFVKESINESVNNIYAYACHVIIINYIYIMIYIYPGISTARDTSGTSKKAPHKDSWPSIASTRTQNVIRRRRQWRLRTVISGHLCEDKSLEYLILVNPKAARSHKISQDPIGSNRCIMVYLSSWFFEVDLSVRSQELQR